MASMKGKDYDKKMDRDSEFKGKPNAVKKAQKVDDKQDKTDAKRFGVKLK